MTCRACGAPLTPEEALVVTPRDPREPAFHVHRPDRISLSVPCFRRAVGPAYVHTLAPVNPGATR